MSFHGQDGVGCDGPECDTTAADTQDVEYAWNSLAADDGHNYYFCCMACLAEWADLWASVESEDT